MITKREEEISLLVSEALSNKKIAERLGISICTVKVHLSNIFRKLKIKNRNQLAISIYRRVNATGS